MIRRISKAHWICLAIGIVGFILGLCFHDSLSVANSNTQVASDLISLSIIAFCMVLLIKNDLNMFEREALEHSDKYHKENSIGFIVLFTNCIIIMIRGITLLNIVTSNELLTIILFALLQGMTFFQLVELIYLLICQLKAWRVK